MGRTPSISGSAVRHEADLFSSEQDSTPSGFVNLFPLSNSAQASLHPSASFSWHRSVELSQAVTMVMWTGNSGIRPSPPSAFYGPSTGPQAGLGTCPDLKSSLFRLCFPCLSMLGLAQENGVSYV